MSQKQTYRTEHSIELLADVVEEITEKLAERPAPTEDDVVDLAHDRVERRTEFVTEGGEPLVDAVVVRIEQRDSSRRRPDQTAVCRIS